MKKCFSPLIDEQTRIFIIGTLPSEISLATKPHLYYANPRNKFWSYIYSILNNGNIPQNPQNLLLSNHIGLWDALKCSNRDGSLDSNIKDEEYNDFSQFKQIKYYIFNGKKAFHYFIKNNKNLLNTNNYQILPSTSPANTSQTNAKKFNQWKECIENLKNYI